MKKRRVWRYKCDFCKKANCSSYHIAKHEKGCTNNPDRVCGMCAFMRKVAQVNGDTFKEPLSLVEAIKLLPLLPDNDEKRIDFLMDGNGEGSEAAKILNTLRQAVNNCPACTLAAIRQSPANGAGQYLPFFDYKTEAKSFWDNYNDESVE